jgi:hypothetical protein
MKGTPEYALQWDRLNYGEIGGRVSQGKAVHFAAGRGIYIFS